MWQLWLKQTFGVELDHLDHPNPLSILAWLQSPAGIQLHPFKEILSDSPVDNLHCEFDLFSLFHEWCWLFTFRKFEVLLWLNWHLYMLGPRLKGSTIHHKSHELGESRPDFYPNLFVGRLVVIGWGHFVLSRHIMLLAEEFLMIVNMMSLIVLLMCGCFLRTNCCHRTCKLLRVAIKLKFNQYWFNVTQIWLISDYKAKIIEKHLDSINIITNT